MSQEMIDGNRTSPEKSLQQIKNENRGKLKIFLGSAPGVGKTYAMLSAAQSLKKDGIDVVIGIVETHGRFETEEMTKDLEQIPLKEIIYKGIAVQELDIDAVITRKPKIVLIDELAHSNVEGCKHLKRYHDIYEVLDAGIDVYTTVNIQHLSSLNDIVRRTTGIIVREVVPDSVFEDADQITLIDLPPSDLQKRLKEGKVYIKDNAEMALENFFTDVNLTALREMMLRFAAGYVDSEMKSFMQEYNVSGPLPTSSKIMVCIKHNEHAEELVRRCKRYADSANISWVAVYIKTPKDYQKSFVEEDNYLVKAITTIEDLGGEYIELSSSSENVADDIIDFAKQNNITTIIVSKTEQKFSFFRTSLANKLLKKNNNIEISIVPVKDTKKASAHKIIKEEIKKENEENHRSYLFAGIISMVSGFVCYALQDVITIYNLQLLFLIGSIYAAIAIGTKEAILSVFINYLLYNILFEASTSLLTVSLMKNLITFLIFLIITIVTGYLSQEIQSQIDYLKQNSDFTANLYAFSKKLSNAKNAYEIIKAVAHHLKITVGNEVIVITINDDELVIEEGTENIDDLSMAAAKWASHHNQMAGRFCSTLPAAKWTFFPMQTETRQIGVIGILYEKYKRELFPAEKRLIMTLSNNAAIAIENLKLSDEKQEGNVISSDLIADIDIINKQIDQLMSDNKVKSIPEAIKIINMMRLRLNRISSSAKILSEN